VIAQGIIVSIWAALLTFGGAGGNLSFLLAMALTVVSYLTMYILLYFAYYRLKSKHGDVPRAYVVPGGSFGRFTIPFLGLLMSVGAFIIAFFPPSTIIDSDIKSYEMILIIGFIVIFFLPHIIYHFRPNKKTVK
jgi:amino acid transporter